MSRADVRLRAGAGAEVGTDSLCAYRARRVLTMAGETAARGEAALCRPLAWLEDALLVTRGGRLLAVESFRPAAVPAGCAVHDLGDVSLVPALVNAHCHLQLAHLAGRTVFGQGFVPWLASLIALLREPLDAQAIRAGAEALRQGGTGLLGDFVSHGMGLTASAMRAAGVDYCGFCEWFGFAAPFIDAERPWPPRCREFFTREADLAEGLAGTAVAADGKAETAADVGACAGHAVADAGGGAESIAADAGSCVKSTARAVRGLAEGVAEAAGTEGYAADASAGASICWQPCGHALYSTHAEVLRDAWRYCHEHGTVFSLHLAEFPEETQLLTQGDGPLAELYTPVVLPPHWRAPGLPPVDLAHTLGLLGPDTLAVHAVQCDAREQRLLAESGTAICLCPRSNAHLAVGVAPVRAYMRERALLCLGTDGLSSNTDMQVVHEAQWLRDRLDIPEAALVRMLTVNGAAALKRRGGRLVAGAPARWAVLPPDWN